MRVNRDFELKINILGGQVIIKPPLRIAFDAQKSISGQLNKGSVQIYNLSEQKRLAIVKDPEDAKRIPIELRIGYQDRLELMFKGNIQECKNERQGADIVTKIDVLDGGFDYLNSVSSVTVKGGELAIEAALADMKNTAKGAVTDRPTLTRPKVLVGNTARIISDMIGPDEDWYIEDEKLYIIKKNEVIGSYISLVSAKTGLISTPTRKMKDVTFKTLLNPSIKPGRRIKLESVTAPYLNGVYKIHTINYTGDNYGDDWSQTCSGYLAGDAKVIA
ncbi:MAG TPA: hypothetical protein VK982_09095 [Bacteroidales bacterium]|nr:hypothetical protein [Bacteroidales bacterium]